MSNTPKKETGDSIQEAAQSDRQIFDCKDNEIISESSHSDKKSLHKKREIPIFGLPIEFQKIVNEVAEGNNAPRDYCVAAMMGTYSAIIRKGVRLTYGNYMNYPALWQIFVGNSSRGKSPVFDWFWRPLLNSVCAFLALRLLRMLSNSDPIRNPPKAPPRPPKANPMMLKMMVYNINLELRIKN